MALITLLGFISCFTTTLLSPDTLQDAGAVTLPPPLLSAAFGLSRHQMK